MAPEQTVYPGPTDHALAVAEPSEVEVEPVKDLKQITTAFQSALQAAHLCIPERLSRAFLTALATKRFAILTGVSGSGKTQIALRLGDWFGEGRSLLVPVRPDWTGPEPLLGYEDALATPNKDGQRPYHAPEVLQFMLKAAQDPHHAYLLILDEMNLAHVERYFADILSGLESKEAVLPNIQNGYQNGKIPLPTNLFIVGTVNVDETTYMFSPKVLDRANTFEFRVETDDLILTESRPTKAQPGDEALVRGFLAIAQDETFQPIEAFAKHMQTLHRLLAAADWEFGHRVFYEANRFAALLAAAGDASLESALDAQVMQKILPRLHGNRRRLEPTLHALGCFCIDLNYDPDANHAERYKALKDQPAKLPIARAKIKRMLRDLRDNQFTSFTGG
jgi:5-methylcytosine-specific restriction protein B